jgi:hypothetical protein
MSSRANALPPPELGVVIKNLWGIRSAPPMGCHPDPFGGPWGVGTGARKPIGGVRSKFSRPPPRDTPRLSRLLRLERPGPIGVADRGTQKIPPFFRAVRALRMGARGRK